MLFVLILLLVGAPSLNAALDSTKSLNTYVRRTWDIDTGLPQNTITAMLQSPDGYMWFGTENGLARFDGRNFTIFDKQHYAGLMSNQISSLAVDKENDLWVGTHGGGVSRFHNGEFHAFLSQSGVVGNSVRCLNADAKGNLWIGTEESGLVRFTSGVFQTYTTASGLLDNSVMALASDANGAVWIATSSGLNLMERGKLTPVMRNDAMNSNFIRTMYLDAHHNLWLGTNGFGVMSWQAGKSEYGTAYTSRQGLTDNVVTSLFQDSADTLWVGTAGGGLNRIANGKLTSLPGQASSRGNAILNMTEDREGGLWIGSTARGVTCFRNNAVTTMSQSSGLPSDTVLPVFEDAQQSLWVGTNQGLACFRKDGVHRFTMREGLPDELVSSITQDGSGTIWIGTRRGLARFNGKRFRQVDDQPGLEANFIHCLLTDRNGDVWIGSRNGLTHFDGRGFVTYTSEDGLPASHVLSVHQSRDGAIWIGTDGGGLAVLREGRFTSYTSHEGLPDDVILAISEDTEGHIYLGTSGAGMVAFSEGRFTSYGTAQGLPDDTIYQIVDDHSGRLWLSSTKGIFSLLKSGLSGWHANGLTKLDYTLYGTGDGMLTRECSGGFQPAGTRTRDGRIWFPTAAGLSVLNPTGLYYNMTPLNVNVERASVDGKWLPQASQLNLPPGSAALTFQYSAPSFTFGNQLQYRYFLTGLEENWNAPTTEQRARYTNVPAGNYEFRVAASRDGQHWFSEAQPVAVSLPERWYQTTSFYVGLCSLTLAIFYGLHLKKVRALRRAAKEAQTPAESIEVARVDSGVDLIRLNTSIVSAPAQILMPQPQQAQIAAIQQVPFLLAALVREVAEVAGLRAQARGLSLVIPAFPKSEQPMAGDAEKLKTVLLSLLDTAIELTPRGSVYLRVASRLSGLSEAEVRFAITDTGMGFLPQEMKKAFQVSEEPEKIMPEAMPDSARHLCTALRLARLMRGEVWVESNPGVGNTFHFRVMMTLSTPSRLMLLEASAI